MYITQENKKMNLVFAILLFVTAVLQIPAILRAKQKEKKYLLNIIIMISCFILTIVSLFI